MKRLLFLIPIIVLLFIPWNQVAIRQAHHTTHHLLTYHQEGEGSCSATAVGKHALLTATHCESGATDEMLMDQTSISVVQRIRDGHDHTILYVRGVTFAYYATVGQPPDVGDPVYVFGNPAKHRDLMRSGVYSGNQTIRTSDGPVLIQFYDLNTYFGDSGAGIFNRYGHLVGVVSITESLSLADVPFKMGGGFTLNFPPHAFEVAAVWHEM